MPDTLLIFGATGQLGQAFNRQALKRGFSVIGAARSEADLDLDITDTTTVTEAIGNTAPSIVINCAALINLDGCENDPALAMQVNAEAVGTMAAACQTIGATFIQISTDHFFTGDEDRLHDEKAPVTLLNEYARSKYAGELQALETPEALVIRTNITGYRGKDNSPTFVEWLIGALESRAPLNLFTDFYTSTLDCESCARAVLDLADKGENGLFNVAARTCMNKETFARTLAGELGIDLDWATTGEVASLPTPRAESLGLDVTKAETALGYKLPDAAQAIKNLVTQYRKDHA